MLYSEVNDMLVKRPYNRERALRYARAWAFSRNPLFYNFTEIGGDCTNFVSQCVLAGCCAMNYTPDFGWYYLSPNDRAPAFTGVEYFWDFFTGAPAFASVNGGAGPFGREVSERRAVPGDAVQLGNEEGDFYHTLLVTGRSREGILVAGHSNDVYDRPLYTYEAPRLRFLHIEGVRAEAKPADCFEDLIAGRALPR